MLAAFAHLRYDGTVLGRFKPCAHREIPAGVRNNQSSIDNWNNQQYNNAPPCEMQPICDLGHYRQSLGSR
jgi:hypothetical protein